MKRLAVLLAVLLFPLVAFGQADLFMKDTPADTGVEPNPDNGPMWVTEDIWVRTAPDPAYQPYPFTATAPPWTPGAHQSPEYRDPKYSTPNYVYIRVRNRGNVASTGNERLRVYWAKASTGLNWPSQWVDYKANNCGPLKLYGMEITKPRKNAATATSTERNTYRDAILAAGTASFAFSDGVSYWHKQDRVHEAGPGNRHGSPAFLPWHREYLNRYEALLQEYEPTLKLLYWDWQTTPPALTYWTSTFMGNATGPNIGAPFNALGGPTVARNVGGSALPGTSDTTVLNRTPYSNFGLIEGNPHNGSHTHIGGNMGSIGTAAEDPFFFMLHGNADRLWARWQRNSTQVLRLDPTQTYGALTTNVNITTMMGPWNGTGTPIIPWTTAGGYIVSKGPTHHSVVSPPIYDTAPLTVPPLLPGQAVVIQVPWFPPKPADFSCFGGDQSHFCLLARIETSTVSPFGMTTLENTSVNANTKANNNIVWKNISVVDQFPGALRVSPVILRNPALAIATTRLHFRAANEEALHYYGEAGNVYLDLAPQLYERWMAEGGRGEGVRPLDPRLGRLLVTSPDAYLAGLRLEPEEAVNVDVTFQLNRNYVPRAGYVPRFDLVQIGTPDDENEVVGGQRFEVDFTKLVLVPANDEKWRYLDDQAAGDGWQQPDYDDAKWRTGRAEFGYEDDPETTVGRRTTTYYRRAFDVADRTIYRELLLHLKRDDGAIVYINGKEVHRVNLDGGGDATYANTSVDGAEEEAFFPVPVPLELIVDGRNVVAVELHQDQKADDATFDLALTANHAVRDTPPNVLLVGPADGALFQPGEAVPVSVDAIDPDGTIKGVNVFVDGKLVATSDMAPFSFNWTAMGAGPHRIRAVAINSSATALTERTITVVNNVPPVVELLSPQDRVSFPVGAPILARATASDRGGRVARVEFWVKEHDSFLSPDRLVAVDTTAPFEANVTLEAGHFMLWAVAVDEGGEKSPSLTVHFTVDAPASATSGHVHHH
ncbi:MAG TPA: tyrosinase family protein [Thermoanaerobaculia bacterium]